MKKSILRRYARLIAVTGANVRPGQEVILVAGLDQPRFVEMLVEECYRAGAGKVRVDWVHDALEPLHAQYQSQETLSRVEDWEKARLQRMVEVLPVRIFLESADPDGLAGICQPKYSNALQARALVQKPYRDAIDGRHQWCIAAVPGKAWAKKVYPSLPAKKAVKRLWKEILRTSRADGPDPLAAWEQHNAALQARCDYLNQLDLRRLHYRAANGTDLWVDLIPGARFLAGRETTDQGVAFNPNIPTEEVFTTPLRGGAQGIVFSTKPLSYQGQLIQDFSLRFENGRVVELSAEKNQDLLQSLVDMDEGARYLGECALVPTGSPVDAAGHLFYNTLFDENASCHLALGEGFCECIPEHGQAGREGCRQRGVNDSIVHTDFMIGCKSLDIDGVLADGSQVPIFRKGGWAF